MAALRTLAASKKTLSLALGGARPLAAAAAARGVATTVSLPDLPYDFGALEPAISGEIMQLHHQKHHATYVTNYNKALEQLDAAVSKGDASAVVQLQGAIKFNGGGERSPSPSLGPVLLLCTRFTVFPFFWADDDADWAKFRGHVNHSVFWKNLKPISEGGGEPPHGKLGWAIDEHFGSFEALVKKMNAEGAALQGSGWVWLALDKEAKMLSVETTPNQHRCLDMIRRLRISFQHRTLQWQTPDPLVTKGASMVPLLGIDVWEHAYYLQYKNVRPDYLNNIWKVINWKYAGEVYDNVLA
ncbi:hypothetical protein EJB05_34932, partial [Eragrostis curvula]